MNLIIDVGNSFVKLAVFSADKLQERRIVELKKLLEAISLLKTDFPLLKNVIISSVGHLNIDQVENIKKEFNLLVLDIDTKLPFINGYSTPETLGVDRIGLVCASVKQFSGKNVLIIDAGTCITYDFVTQENKYLGGAISPGLAMRYKSLNNLTAKLPLLELSVPKNIIGNSTANSIHSGVVNGVINEVDGIITQYKTKFSDLTVILTGGDAKFLSKQLKSSIFANSNFLLEGLNYILQLNSNE
ncbi:type III pantothenate kinase [Tamlana sp. 2_MG-2023]|uniref:type III pantothenate kinase n=1 Tax=unclassified Tamlana TaxID=2614803 RepID=UPI0026E3DFD3|nr:MULTISPECIES: type III pantothenate kinase [unclassified Tamlana]MDO6760366.1 type III pantothenate kinase [Tamlana sp. 2_MG-2023]MDO6789936.1 type III pantothenate kinase [Tamlana sp. 1_MG-2023]